METMKTTKTVVIVSALAMILCLTQLTQAQGANAWDNWPQDPEWTALTNHIRQCYEGIVARCRVANVSTNEFNAPEYLYPMSDYVRFAQKLSEISSFFVCPTNFDANGTLETYFSTPLQPGEDGYVAGQVNYHTTPIFWSPSTILRHLGYEGWHTNTVLHSWSAVDRSIQTQVTEVLNLLVWTEKVPTWEAPAGNPENHRYVVLPGFGSAEDWDDMRYWTEYYFAQDYAKKTGGNYVPMLDYSTSVGVWKSGTPGDSLRPIVGTVAAYDPYWISFPWGWDANTAAEARQAEMVLNNLNAKTVAFYTKAQPPQHGWVWYPYGYQPAHPLVDTWDAYGQPVANGYFRLLNTVNGSGMQTARSASLGQTAFPVWCDMPLENEGWLPKSRGFEVVDELALVQWDFPTVNSPQNVASKLPDTDMDDIVEVAFDSSAPGADTGTMLFTAEDDKPQVFLPVVATPVWYGGLPVHGYLTQGSAVLPYNYLITHDLKPVWNTVIKEQDNDGPAQAFSLNTMVVESGCIVNEQTKTKKASVLRPRGNVVIFDFPWNAQTGTFSETGYPEGVNSNRTYILRDRTPEYHRDHNYDLCFASGIIHQFGFSVQESLDEVLEWYAGDWEMLEKDFMGAAGTAHFGLMKVKDSAERTTRVAVVDTDCMSGVDTAYRFRLPGCELDAVWGAYMLSVVSRPPSSGRNDCRNVGIHWNNGRPTEITYRVLGRLETITNILAYTDGRITGLNKSGMPGIDSANAVLSSDNTITHPWGTVTRTQTSPAGNARTVSIARTIVGSDSVVTDIKCDAGERITERKTSVNGGNAITTYAYNSAEGRYANGFPKRQKISNITWPDQSTVGFDYYDDAANPGWLKTETRTIGNGLARVTRHYYSMANGGDSADPAQPLERPRKTETIINGVNVGRSLFSYSGCSRVIAQICANAQAEWDSSGNFVVTNTYASGDVSEGLLVQTSGTRGTRDYGYGFSGGYLKLEYDDGVYSMRYVFNSLGELSCVVDDSERDVTSERINGLGMTVYSSVTDRSSGVKTAESSSSVDAFGRIHRTDYLDGTFTICTNYDLYGPQTVVGIDGSSTVYVHDEAGRNKSVQQPSLGVAVERKFDALGNVTNILQTGGSESLSESATFDIHGRMLSRTDVLGSTTWSHTDSAGGLTRVCTLPNGGTITEEFNPDGSLRVVKGNGTTRCMRFEAGVENGMYYEKTICLDLDGNTTEEWTKTWFDFMGRPFKIQRNGVNSFAETRYDNRDRVFKWIDEKNIARVVSYDHRNEVEHAGLHVDGAVDAPTPMSNDRIRKHTRTVSQDGIRRETYIYPLANNSSSTLLSTIEKSLNGRKVVSSLAGRNSMTTASPCTQVAGNGGCYGVTNVSSDGRKVVADYEKWRLRELRQYDSDGVVCTEKETYLYTGLGLLDEVRNNIKGVTKIHRDSQKRVINIDRPGTTEDVWFAYHGNTTLVEVETDANGATTRYEYFLNGLLKRRWDGTSHDVSYQYDGQGRCCKMTTLRNGHPTTTEWVYNPKTGWLEKKQMWFPGATEPVVVASYQHEDNGRISEVIRPGSTLVETYHYDPVSGDLSGLTYNDGTAPVSFGLNRMGQMVSAEVGGGVKLQSTLDIEGRPLAVQVTGGIVSNSVFEYAYAPEHQGLTNLSYRIDAEPTNRTVIAYDARARIAVVSNGGILVSYTYATNTDLLVSTVVSNNAGKAMKRVFQWDYERSRLTNISYQIDGITVASQDYTCATNDKRIVKITMQDGAWWEYSYDVMGQVLTGRVCNAQGEEIPGLKFGYEYDSIGNVVRAGPPGNDGKPRYEFVANDLNQHVERRWGGRVDVIGSAYTGACVSVNDVIAVRRAERYSAIVPVDNQTSASFTNITVRAVWNNGVNDVVSTVSGSMVVPKACESVGQAIRGVVSDDSRFTYSFNFRDQLVSAQSKTGLPGVRVECDYYPSGQRARKLVYRGENGAWTLDREYRYYWDGWNLVHQTEICHLPSGTRTNESRFIWGLDLAGWRTGEDRAHSVGDVDTDAGGIGGLLCVVVSVNGSQSDVYLPVSDHNGNILRFMDGVTGETVADFTYSPFGVLVGFKSQSSSAVFDGVCPFRFQSKCYDAELGLYYFGFRYYDPASGKWLSMDPLGEKPDTNMNRFCNNDPVNNVDPLGLKVIYMISEEYFDEMAESLEVLMTVSLQPTATEAERKAAVKSGARLELKRSIERQAKNVVERLRNIGATEKEIEELTPEVHIVKSTADVANLVVTKKNEVSAKDHFILHTHSTGSQLKEGTVDYLPGVLFDGKVIGGSTMLILNYVDPKGGTGGRYQGWESQQLREMFSSFKGQASDLALFVCRVSRTRAEWIRDASGADRVYFSTSVKSYEKIANFGVYIPSKVTESSRPRFDPTLSESEMTVTPKRGER